jgi:hypothetical protein
MNRFRLVGSIITITVFLLSLLAPATGILAALAPAKAQSMSISASYINYNIIEIKLTGFTKDEPPALRIVNATGGYKWLVLGYIGFNTWVAYIALDKAAGVSFSGTKADNLVAEGGYTVTGYEPTAYVKTTGLANAAPVYGSLIAIAATTNLNITVGTDVYVSGLNASSIWPIINTVSESWTGGEITVEVYGLSLSKTIEVTPTGFTVVSKDRTQIPPEGYMRLTVKDEALPTDPTKYDSSYNALAITNSTTVSAGTPVILKTGVGTIAALLTEEGVLSGSLGSNYLPFNVTVTADAKVNVSVAELPPGVTFTPAALDNLTVFAVIYANTTAGKDVELVVPVNSTTYGKFVDVSYEISGATLDKVKEVKLVFVPYALSLKLGIESKPLEYMPVVEAYPTATGGEYQFTFYLAPWSQAPAVPIELGMTDKPAEAALAEGLPVPGATSTTLYLSVLRVDGSFAPSSEVKVPVGRSTTIYVVDPDANKDTEVVDTVDVKVSVGSCTKTVTLEETGENTGKFALTVAVEPSNDTGLPKIEVEGTGYIVVYVSPMNVSSGVSVEVLYNDTYGAESMYVPVYGYVDVYAEPIEVVPAATSVNIGSDITIYLKANVTLNIYPDAIEAINVTNSSKILSGLKLPAYVPNGAAVTWLDVKSYYNETPVGILYAELIDTSGATVKVFNSSNILDYIKRIDKAVVAYENGTDTGVYEITFNGELLKPLEGVGYKLKIVFYDLYTGQLSTISISIGGVAGKIYTYAYSVKSDTGSELLAEPKSLSGIPALFYTDSSGNVKAAKYLEVQVHIEDPDYSSSKVYVIYMSEGVVKFSMVLPLDSEQNAYFYVYYIVNSTGEYYNITNGTVSYTVKAADAISLGTLRIEYPDPAGNEKSVITSETVVAKEMPFTVADDKIEVTPSEVTMAEPTVTVKLVLPDLALLDYLPQDLGFTVTVGEVTKSWSVADLEPYGGMKKVSSDTWAINITVLDLAGMSRSISTVEALAGQTMTLTYTDPATTETTTAGLKSAETTAEVKIKSFTGTVSLLPSTEISPYGVLKITVKDPDMAYLTAEDVAKQVQISYTVNGAAETAVLADLISSGKAEVDINETNVTTGVFVYKVKLTYSEDNLTGRLPVDLNTPIYVIYTDPVSASGTKAAITASVTVKATTGVIEVPSMVTVTEEGSKLVIKVIDKDANIDPDREDAIAPGTVPYSLGYKLVVMSDDYRIPIVVPLKETGPNTGVFEGYIILTSDPTYIGTPGYLYVKPGSKVYVEYTDHLTANGTIDVTIEKTVETTAKPVTRAEVDILLNGQQIPVNVTTITTPVKVSLLTVTVPFMNATSADIEYKGFIVVYYTTPSGAVKVIDTIPIPSALLKAGSTSMDITIDKAKVDAAFEAGAKEVKVVAFFVYADKSFSMENLITKAFVTVNGQTKCLGKWPIVVTLKMVNGQYVAYLGEAPA